MVPFQPPINRPRPMPMQPQSQMNTGWRDVYTPFRQDQQRLSLPGFYISSPQDIAPRDVPMDGSISFFPANDLSYIVIKQWTGNGTIAEARYVLEQPSSPSTNQQQENEQASEPTPTNNANTESGNSEIVEVISEALNEQTQRLTAAFSQIGLAFNTLQQKLDSFAQAPVESIQSQIAEDFQEIGAKNPEPVERPKAPSRPKSKEIKENEKP